MATAIFAVVWYLAGWRYNHFKLPNEMKCVAESDERLAVNLDAITRLKK
jgi:hypothetical protein